MGYLFGGNTGLTQAQVKRLREEAAYRSKGGPSRNLPEGLGVLADAIAGWGMRRRADKAETAGLAANKEAFSGGIEGLLKAIQNHSSSGGGADTPGGGVADSGVSSSSKTETSLAGDPNGPSPGAGSPAQPASYNMASLRNAIASIESRGQGNYTAEGPKTKSGDRAYGRYQVMGANLPQWTKAATGQEMSAKDFLASPEAQDSVFDNQFGGYVEKYGNPQDAASMWFTGKPMAQGANRSDVLGTSQPEYLRKFNAALSNPADLQAGESMQIPKPNPLAEAGIRPPAPIIQAQMRTAFPSPPQGAQPGVQQRPPQVAQAGAQAPQQGLGPAMQGAMDAMGSPWIQPGQRALLGALIKQRMEQMRPRTAIEKAELEKLRLGNVRTPGGLTRSEAAIDADRDRAFTERSAEQIASGDRAGRTADLAERSSLNGYMIHLEQAKAAGKDPMPVEQYLQAIKKSGATNINVAGGDVLSADATKGLTAVDKAYAPDYVEWTQGGAADTLKLTSQLRASLTGLRSGKNLTGPIVGQVPDWLNNFINPDAIDNRERVEEAIQRNLKAILGGQFTEREGEKLVARAYNPALDESKNIERLGRLITQMEIASEQKNSASEYWRKNGTLTGWEGKMPTWSDFNVFDEDTKPAAEMTSDEIRKHLERGGI